MPEHITLTQLQTLIKNGLEASHPLPYWVVAEVSDAKLHLTSGHFYLDLVEKGGENHVPKAKVRAMIWKKDYKLIGPYFGQVTGSEIVDGMKIMVKVRVSYHEVFGLTLCISDIDPAYTLGDMERQRQETIMQLQEDGVFDMNREVGFPLVVQRIAVVSSATAAGYQDFTEELSAGRYRFCVTLFEAYMQGEAAEESIISALGRIAEVSDDFDAVVIIRGGGSQSDLGCFNSYRLCCHVAQFPLPVITGIGHDKDSSVADLVAAESLKTPTAVAVSLNERMRGFEQALQATFDNLIASAHSIVSSEKERLHRTGAELKFRTIGWVRNREELFGRLAMKIDFAYKAVIGNRKMLLEDMVGDIENSARLCVSNAAGYLKNKESLFAAYDPERILSRGYSIVRRNGSVLKDTADIDPGDGIEIENKDCFIEATINNIRL